MNRIDTIFYFAKNEEEYRNANVSPHTIVFVEETREIYLNGYGYGKTSTAGLMSESEYKAWKSLVELRIQNVINAAELKNLELLDRWLGELDNLYDRMIESIQGVSNSLSNRIDEIESLSQQADLQISDVNDRLDEVQADLLERIGNMDNSVQQNVVDQLETHQDLLDGHDTRITALEGDVVQIRRSYVENTDSTWTDFVLNYDGIKSTTNKVNQILDLNGDIKYTAVQSLISQGISENEAFIALQSRWALVDENEDILKWLASGFDSSALPNLTFASMYSAAMGDFDSRLQNINSTIGDLDNTFSEIDDEFLDIYRELQLKAEASVISSITTRVENLENGGFITSAELSSLQAIGYIFTETTEIYVTAERTINSTVSIPTMNCVFTAQEVKKMLGEPDYQKVTSASPDMNNNLGIYKIKVPEQELYIYVNIRVRTITIADMSTQAYPDHAVSLMSARFEEFNTLLGQHTQSLSSIQNSVNDHLAALNAVTSYTVDGQGSKTYFINESALDQAMVSLLSENNTNNTSTRGRISALAAAEQVEVNIDAAIDNHTISGLQLKSYIDQNGGSTAGFALASEVFDDPTANPKTIKGQAAITGKVNEQESVLESVTTYDHTNPSSAHTYSLLSSKVNEALVSLLADSGQDTTGLTAKSMIQAMAQSGSSTIDLATSLSDSRSNPDAVSGLNLGSYISEYGGSTAGFALAADVFDTGTTDIKGMSSLQGVVDYHTSTLSGLTEWRDNETSRLTAAGFLTSSNLNQSIASFFATSTQDRTTTIASIVAAVNGADSSVEISADKIRLTGTTFADTILALMVNVGDWTLSSGALTGGDTADKGNSSTGYYRHNVSLTPESLLFTKEDKSTTQNDTSDDVTYRLQITPSNGITFDKKGASDLIYTPSTQFNIDGSGFIAGGSIQWNQNGELSVVGNVSAAQFIAGDSQGFNITTSAGAISFNQGNDARAIFTAENGGAQLRIKRPDVNGHNEWYSINFDQWSRTSGNVDYEYFYKVENDEVVEVKLYTQDHKYYFTNPSVSTSVGNDDTTYYKKDTSFNGTMINEDMLQPKVLIKDFRISTIWTELKYMPVKVHIYIPIKFETGLIREFESSRNSFVYMDDLIVDGNNNNVGRFISSTALYSGYSDSVWSTGYANQKNVLYKFTNSNNYITMEDAPSDVYKFTDNFLGVYACTMSSSFTSITGSITLLYNSSSEKKLSHVDILI